MLIARQPIVSLAQRRRAFVWMLITVPLAGAGVDMFLPSLPAMMKAMHASAFEVQMTVLAYLAIYGLGQIFFGPVVDRWGRRIPTALGAAVMAGAGFAIANSNSIEMVIAMRMLQGIGGAVTAVAARCIVADCYEGHARVRAANWMTIAWACGPVLSPALGGNLQVWFDWHATFWVLGGWATVTVFTSLLLLPETRRIRSTASFIRIFAPYRKIATDPIYVPATLAIGCLATVIYAFEVLAPFYVQVDLHQGPVFYGHLQLAMGALWMAGNLTNRYLQHVSTDFRRSMVAAVLAISVSAGMIAVDRMGGFNLLWLAVPSGLVYFSAATIWPNLYAICLGRFPHAGGAANGLVSGMFCLISFTFTLAGTMLQSATAWPLWSIFTLSLVIALMLLACFLRQMLTQGVGHMESLAEA